MGRLTDEWIDERVDRWMGEQMDACGCLDKRMDILTGESINGYVNERG